MPDPAPLLEYWFGPRAADEAVPPTTERWFRGGDAIDAEVSARFGAWIEPALRGELDDWQQTPEGALALVVLLDQFSRNVHRGTPLAFAGDAKAKELAERAIARGDDQKVPLVWRTFFYLPFEHAESLADQARSVELAARSRDAAPPEARDLLESFYDYAVRHQRVIERFGRFPHRNEILGRPSSADELAFLEQPGSSF